MSEKTSPKNKVIGTFQKNAFASIQVTLVNREGKDYLDIREVVPSDKPGERFAFTKSGIQIKADLVDKLRELLAQVQVSREAQTEGSGCETESSTSRTTRKPANR